MGQAAEKLPDTESAEERPLELPPLPKGEEELLGIHFPVANRLGSNLTLGRNFNEFDISGQIMRIAVQQNGNAYLLIRVGGTSDTTGLRIMGGRWRKVIFFQNGMYAAVKE